MTVKLSFYEEFNSEMIDIIRLGRILVSRSDVFVYGNNGLIHNPVFNSSEVHRQATDIQSAIWIKDSIRHLAFDWFPSKIQSEIIEKYQSDNNCDAFTAIINIDFFGLRDMLR